VITSQTPNGAMIREESSVTRRFILDKELGLVLVVRRTHQCFLLGSVGSKYEVTIFQGMIRANRLFHKESAQPFDLETLKADVRALIPTPHAKDNIVKNALLTALKPDHLQLFAGGFGAKVKRFVARFTRNLPRPMPEQA